MSGGQILYHSHFCSAPDNQVKQLRSFAGVGGIDILVNSFPVPAAPNIEVKIPTHAGNQ